MERHGGWTGAARIAALAALILLSFAGGGGAAAAADPIGADRLTGLDAYLARAREEMGIPGVALVVVEGDQIVHLTALGVADGSGRPVTPQTPFMLASVSKAFTAMAVLQQVEAGRLDLDAPAQRYLPWFAVADTDAATQITLHQLLYHTSGLSPTSGQAYHDSDDQDVGALERAVRALASTSLVAAPGAEHQYSNSNYDVLGLIVEAVSGEPFSAYIEEHVFAALDMTHSHALLRSAQADGLAAGYYHWFGLAWQPAPIPLPRAGGPSATMFASAEDLGHQLIAHLNEGHYGSNRVLSPAGIATLHAAGVETDEFNGYAMGWNVRPLWEALDPTTPNAAQAYELPVLLEHGGEWPNGHTYVAFVPALGWGFGLLVNAADFGAASRFWLLEENVLRILTGRDPLGWSPAEDLLTQHGRLVAALLLLAELGSFVWWVRKSFRRGLHDGSLRGRRLVLAATLSTGLDVLVVWLILAYAPGRFETTFSVFVREAPDLGLLALPTLALALIWGPIRTILLARFILRRRPAHAPIEGPPLA